jgi:hypothetical protein
MFHGGSAIQINMNLQSLAITDAMIAPLALGGLGAAATLGLWLAARWGLRLAMPLRFLATLAGTWLVLCVAYVIVNPGIPFISWHAGSKTDSFLATAMVTELVAAIGTAFYIGSLLSRRTRRRPWRRSSALVAGLVLMGSAFLRSTYQPAVAPVIEAPLALVFVATAWRLRAEILIYLSLLAVAVAAVMAARLWWTAAAEGESALWVISTGSGSSILMVIVAIGLSLVRQPQATLRWYKQGLLIVPLFIASLAALAAGYVAAWYGPTWHTVWAVGAWWAVLLVSSIGLRLPDLFGFSSIGAALAAVAAFAVVGGDHVGGYWGRYPPLLLGISLGAALLSSLLHFLLAHRPAAGFARALYLVAAAIAVAALVVEPLDTTAKYLGIDLLGAAIVLVLAHIHRAPAWVNYLVAILVTSGVAPLVHLSPGTDPILWHHRFILVTAWAAVAWLIVSLAVREVLRRSASDRTARRQSLPFTILGMTTTVFLAAYLAFHQWTVYAMILAGTGADETATILAQLGPDWGLGGWCAVLLAWTLSMWLVRHTARTFLFYCFGISTLLYLGLYGHRDDLYSYLIYAIAGYGASHLAVYLVEQKFMNLLSRVCALYRDEKRASTTIFTLAGISCLAAAVLAGFRLNTPASAIMLAVMTGVFLAWSFVWMRGVMLYPAILMVTMTVLALWHNFTQPHIWDAGRLAINSGVMTMSALVWLGVGKGLHPVRGEVSSLAGPARISSVILGMLGTGFAAVLAVSPIFPAAIWRQDRSAWDWTVGVTALVLMMGYFAWARFAFERRFYSLMSAFGLLLLGLYFGIYVGMRVVVKG